jgi:hypothetical protein
MDIEENGISIVKLENAIKATMQETLKERKNLLENPCQFTNNPHRHSQT